jgi:outer membrane biosynthesis protein TonB
MALVAARQIGTALLLLLTALALAAGCARNESTPQNESVKAEKKPKKILQTLGAKAEKKEEKKEEPAQEKREERKEEAAAEEKEEKEEKEEEVGEVDEKEGVKAEDGKVERLGNKHADHNAKTKGTKLSRLSRDRFTARVTRSEDGNADVDRAIRRRLSGFRNCYAQLLARDRNITGGDVKLRYTIGREGRVLRASVEKNETDSAALEECMIKKLKLVRFPKQDAELEQSLAVSFANGGSPHDSPGNAQY